MLPPQSSTSYTRTGSYSSDEASVRSLPPPHIISTCLEPTASLLERSSPNDILSFIPHPVLYPFFDHFSVSSRYIEQQYRQVLDMHEILRIEEMLQTVRQNKYPFQNFQDARDTASTLTRKVVEGLSYIEKHCRESGMKIDLRAIREDRKSSFESVYPYTVLLPYTRAQGFFDEEDGLCSNST
ncbi:hypothetical protein BDZ94DRAFT_1324658 [Collybia nuda]|uniref:Uncharacterized protein n=1 Tax=Collybia nuda TaxID=64659 RepID=A0A9P6CEW3_9AGAR|nr:hypothetical protein BDZ94DRAFT_1324658 [Collybia nuda]